MKQLTPEQGEQIRQMFYDGASITKIARSLHRHNDTINAVLQGKYDFNSNHMVRHHPEPTKPKNTVKHKPVPIGKIISEAKKAGLSYGQYVARRTV